MVEDEGGLLVGEVFALRGQVAAGGVQRAVDLAVVEDGVAVAVDEVDVAGDDAVGEVAARGSGVQGTCAAVRAVARRREGASSWAAACAGCRPGRTARADVERVLVAENVNVGEDVAVAFDVERLRLRACRDLLMGAVEVVLEGDVVGVEVVAEDVDGGVAGLGAAGALAGVVDDDGLWGRGRCP